jgi:hypothetical protein
MNTRPLNHTDRIKQEFADIREYYAGKGITVSGMRKLNYAGKYRIETGTHGWYATFTHDSDGKIVRDVQTIS